MKSGCDVSNARDNVRVIDSLLEIGILHVYKRRRIKVCFERSRHTSADFYSYSKRGLNLNKLRSNDATCDEVCPFTFVLSSVAHYG